MLHSGTHNFLSAVYLLLFKKMKNSSCYLFCIKMTKSKFLNFQSKINKFSRLLFSMLSQKSNPLVHFFSSTRQCQIVFGTEILRLFEKVLFLMYYNLRVNSPFRSRNSLIGFFPKFTMLWYVYGACSKITRG